ncbi:hypothetical protein OWV82_022018 [Melia azedarach]|uniref:Uncharacterized protein n=1 Tax=Melia azedarach TaxID=155640 RepID=A0ACC1X4V3_MELAZ|nr:hypothetical protein OWV82_022018 [Melia azedarach]
MEKQKIRYQKEFAKRIKTEKWQELVTFIEKKEQYIRNSYQEMPKFGKDKFITMILYDAIFIIELFIRCEEEQNDFLLRQPRLKFAIRTDLQLLENQLPYSIVEDLYKIASPTLPTDSQRRCDSFFEYSCNFFSIDIVKEKRDEGNVKHFVDLRRKAMTRKYPKLSSREEYIDFPASALKLQKSGVKFKHNESPHLLDIKFEKTMSRIPWLQVHDELQIPQIEISDETECLIRNVMALEQCHYPTDTHVCNYIHLMDDLIDTKEDVELLVEAKIISNLLGDTARIAEMFNALCLQITWSSSCYQDITKKLKAHYENRWNHAMATLKRVYFSNYWRGTGTIAAIVILLLTLIQTVCSILQVVQFD